MQIDIHVLCSFLFVVFLVPSFFVTPNLNDQGLVMRYQNCPYYFNIQLTNTIDLLILLRGSYPGQRSGNLWLLLEFWSSWGHWRCILFEGTCTCSQILTGFVHQGCCILSIWKFVKERSDLLRLSKAIIGTKSHWNLTVTFFSCFGGSFHTRAQVVCQCSK